MKKTKWFSGNTNPELDGWYEFKFAFGRIMLHRHRNKWFLREDQTRSSFPVFFGDKWRGLKEKA